MRLYRATININFSFSIATSAIKINVISTNLFRIAEDAV